MCPEFQDDPKTSDHIRQSQGGNSIHEGKDPHRKICGDLAHRKDAGRMDKFYMETPRAL